MNQKLCTIIFGPFFCCARIVLNFFTRIGKKFRKKLREACHE